MQRIELEPAFVLHQRPYRNTSLLLELFTMQYGRISVVARSARGPKSRFRGRLQLFTPLLANWYGRTELKTLTQMEWPKPPFFLDGETLFCGFYLNELLMKLLQREDAYPQLFFQYQNTLEKLQERQSIAQVLRRFEKSLLLELGYGLPLQYEAMTHEPIVEGKNYQYVPSRGFFCSQARVEKDIFSGRCLIALEQDDWNDEDLLKESKRLMRMAMTELLSGQTIRSRELVR